MISQLKKIFVYLHYVCHIQNGEEEKKNLFLITHHKQYQASLSNKKVCVQSETESDEEILQQKKSIKLVKME